MKTSGFSLAELLVVLVLFGLLGSLGIRILVTHRRSLDREVYQIDSNANTRMLIGLLGSEFRALGVSLTGDPDLRAFDSLAVTYRSAQGLFTVCDVAPGVGGAEGVVVTRGFGIDLPDPAIDSVSVYVGPPATDDTGTAWVDMALTAVTPARCPDGSRALNLTLAGGPLPASPSLRPGVPLQTFSVQTLRYYRASDGYYYLGLSRFKRASGRFTRIQPVVGPFPQEGLRFSFHTSDGSVTRNARAVRRTVVHLKPGAFDADRAGGSEYHTSFTLRNFPR